MIREQHYFLWAVLWHKRKKTFQSIPFLKCRGIGMYHMVFTEGDENLPERLDGQVNIYSIRLGMGWPSR